MTVRHLNTEQLFKKIEAVTQVLSISRPVSIVYVGAP